MTLWACVIYDKYWALFLGRPTSIKSADIEIYTLARQFERLGTCRPAGTERNTETLIYEALIDLMELAGRITENMDPKSQESVDTRSQYRRMATLDRQFSTWYSKLPEQLRWTPQNVATAPFSFFLLHQQYHASVILLHRPFAMYEDDTNPDSTQPPASSQRHPGSDEHFSALSRSVCTKHAIRIARIFWQHRKRFDTRQVFVTGLQHAGTAATALVAALAFLKDPNDRNNNMQYLECLSAALHDMAQTYQPAERMSTVLNAVMVELRSDTSSSTKLLDSSAGSVYAQDPFSAAMNLWGSKTDAASVSHLYRSSSTLVPARRGSANVDSASSEFLRPQLKRRQTTRPRPHSGNPPSEIIRGKRSMSMSMATGIPSLPCGTDVRQPPIGGIGFAGPFMYDSGPLSAPSESQVNPWALESRIGNPMGEMTVETCAPGASILAPINFDSHFALPTSLPSASAWSSSGPGVSSMDYCRNATGQQSEDTEVFSALAGVHFPEINGNRQNCGQGLNVRGEDLDFLALGARNKDADGWTYWGNVMESDVLGQSRRNG